MTEKASLPARKWVLRILFGLIGLALICFFGLQMVPVQRDNPPVVNEPNWDSPQTRELARRACFDCHSNETVWPWYSYVAPVSWLVTHDVQGARARFNFSEWGGRGARRVDEMAEVISDGAMPPANYLSMHPDARLSDAEEQQLIAGLRASLGR